MACAPAHFAALWHGGHRHAPGTGQAGLQWSRRHTYRVDGDYRLAINNQALQWFADCPTTRASQLTGLAARIATGAGRAIQLGAGAGAAAHSTTLERHPDLCAATHSCVLLACNHHTRGKRSRTMRVGAHGGKLPCTNAQGAFCAGAAQAPPATATLLTHGLGEIEYWFVHRRAREAGGALRVAYSRPLDQRLRHLRRSGSNVFSGQHHEGAAGAHAANLQRPTIVAAAQRAQTCCRTMQSLQG